MVMEGGVRMQTLPTLPGDHINGNALGCSLLACTRLAVLANIKHGYYHKWVLTKGDVLVKVGDCWSDKFQLPQQI